MYLVGFIILFNQEGKFSNKKAMFFNTCKSLFTRIRISICTATSTSRLVRVICTGKESSMKQWQEGANEEMNEVGQLTNYKRTEEGMPNEED